MPVSNLPTRRSVLMGMLAPLQRSVLVHEHVLVDFVGADKVSRSRYDVDEVFRTAMPRLAELRNMGCRRLHECTPNFLGRDPRLLRGLAERTGLEIWTNTGLYGARNHMFLPEYARQETAEQLAARWIEEARRGVEGMKPRFIKIGVNNAPLHELDRKLVEAAAMTSRETGLTICSHTGGGGAAALEQLDIVNQRRLRAERFVWVHAQSEKDHALHEKVARLGAWVEFDGINEKSAAWHKECVEFMQSKNLLGRTLISQDSGWYHVGEPGGGEYRGYTYIYEGFVPQIGAKAAKTLLVDNPDRAFGL